jgi:hypothetical protein
MLAAAITPSSVQDIIRRHGAKTAIDEMGKSGAWEKVVVPEISSGAIKWVKLAPALSDGTDAGTSEQLGQSLIYALPRSPAAVLSILDLTGQSLPRSPAMVCSASFYEGDPTDPVKYKIMARNAVSHVTDPALRAAKQACLSKLS